MKNQDTGSAALTDITTAKKKIDELAGRNKFEEVEVLKLKLMKTTPNICTIIAIKDKRDASKKNAVEFNINKQL